MAKKVTGYIKLQIPAGQANPSPPVGPALGQQGVNIMEFCKAFNAQTQSLGKGIADPSGDHGVQRPQLHLHHEDPARLGAHRQGASGFRRAAPRRTPPRWARFRASSSRTSPR